MPDFVVVGAGRCGLQLARALAAAGRPPTAVVARSAAAQRRVRRVLPGVRVIPSGTTPPAARGLLIAVPDDALADCAAALAPRLPDGYRWAIHTSGLHPAAVLEPLAERGCRLASFHPLLAFPSPTGPLVGTAGAIATVEGDRSAVIAARGLALTLGMAVRRITPKDKARYHAAAVIAANLTHALIVAARKELTEIGFSSREANRALAALVRATLDSALSSSGWENLTGPLVRGDVKTIREHLRALPPDLAEAYRAVAKMVLERLPAKPSNA